MYYFLVIIMGNNLEDRVVRLEMLTVNLYAVVSEVSRLAGRIDRDSFAKRGLEVEMN